MTRDFRDIIYPLWEGQKFVCVGLDSVRERLPRDPRLQNLPVQRVKFNLDIVDATMDIACAYKLNPFAYRGPTGKIEMYDTLRKGMQLAPHALWILDAKYGDTENSNEGYAEEVFDDYGADAVTVHNYLGGEALKPFFSWKKRLTFVLCRTSNPGAREFQDIADQMGERLYHRVARSAATEWARDDNCGLVVGATYPGEMTEVREIASNLPILSPGAGEQRGDTRGTVQAAKHRMLISNSRGITFASSAMDFAEAAREVTLNLHETILAAV